VRLQPAEVAEDVLLPVTTYVVVPIFVFVNAGLNFASVELSGSAETMIFAGVLAGLILGKPIGILGASFIATQLRLAKKPRGVTWTHILGIGFICGIGFTIALLVTSLSYRGENGLQQAAIVGVYAASLVSGVIGVLILKFATRKHPKRIA
jgi:Na+:H+ antiporter, NhaA family